MHDQMVKIMASTRLVVYGASGRLGTRVCGVAAFHEGVQLVGAVTHEGSASIGRPAHQPDVPGVRTPKIQAKTSEICDVIIDASTPQGAIAAASHAGDVGAALVVCTTGLDPSTIEKISSISTRSPVIIAANTSLGLAATRKAAGSVGRALLGRADVGVVDIHRSGKRDAPSGTALVIARDLRSIGYTLPDCNVVSLRSGNVVGEHVIRFDLDGETIEITHRVRDVEVFAQGAVHAALWLIGKQPGMYTMADVLGENA